MGYSIALSSVHRSFCPVLTFSLEIQPPCCENPKPQGGTKGKKADTSAEHPTTTRTIWQPCWASEPCHMFQAQLLMRDPKRDQLKNYADEPLSTHRTVRNNKIIVFKPVNLGVVCYTARDIWNKHLLLLDIVYIYLFSIYPI